MRSNHLFSPRGRRLFNFRQASTQLSSYAVAMALGVSSLWLTGCGVGSPGSPAAVTSINNLGGSVHGGEQPITGANMYLYLTNANGYSATPTLLAGGTGASISTAEVLTNSFGGFNFGSLAINYNSSTASTNPGICTPNSQVYILAAGGNPGFTATNGSPNPNNSAILLAASLGPCTSITDSTTVQINELTTVAAAYAMQGFAPSTGFTTASTLNGDNTTYTNTVTGGFTTNANNAQGIVDAFANAGSLVSTSTGTANTSNAGGGAVPQLTIDTIGNILQYCVNSTGTIASPSAACSSLFSYALPVPTQVTPKVIQQQPGNTLQAAINLAQNPAALAFTNTSGTISSTSNVGNLYGLISSPVAFGSYLSGAPSDFSLAIVYPSSLPNGAQGIAIDNSDNVYVTNNSTTTPQLLKFGAQGGTGTVLGSLNTGDTIRGLAVDGSGNIWLSDHPATGSYIYEYTTGGSTLQQTYSSPSNNNNFTLAIDQDGDVWTDTYKAGGCSTSNTGSGGCTLVEFYPPATGTTYTATNTFSTSYNGANSSHQLGGARSIAFDVKTNNIWYTDISDNYVGLFKPTPVVNAAATATAYVTHIELGGSSNESTTPASFSYGTWGVAVDGASNSWITLTGGPAVTGPPATAAVTPAIYEYNASGTLVTSITGAGLNGPAGDLIDGAGNLFIANAGSNGIMEYSPAISQFVSESGGYTPTTYSSALNYTVYKPQYVAVDRSGALWTYSAGDGATTSANLVQIFGIAAPTNPILSAGQYGEKPQ